MLSALKELDQLYREIEDKILGTPAPGMGHDTAALSDLVVSNQQLVTRMDQVNARFAEVAAQWWQSRGRLSRQEHEKVRMLADEVRQRTSRLLARCGGRAAQLQAAMARLQHELGQLRNGARYLHSSRPARTNYPKFIDSHG